RERDQRCRSTVEDVSPRAREPALCKEFWVVAPSSVHPSRASGRTGRDVFLVQTARLSAVSAEKGGVQFPGTIFGHAQEETVRLCQHLAGDRAHVCLGLQAATPVARHFG